MADDRGHVFVVHGDLLRLECDAWLLPSDSGGSLAKYWKIGPNHDIRTAWTWPDFGWAERGRSVALEGDLDRPRPFVTHVGGGYSMPTNWFVDGAIAFVSAAHERVRAHGERPRNGRARHLFALPIVGTGFGGGARRAAEIVELLLPALEREADTRGIDVALVAKDVANYAAAQEVRRRVWCEIERREGRGCWSALDPTWKTRAIELAEMAERRRLVLFLGAGISRGAGLPVWSELLRGLADDARMSDDERAQLEHLDLLDRAQVLEKRFQTRQMTIGERVSARLRSPRCSLAHALLASLPVDEIVTTNYDELFELADRGCRGEGSLEVLGPGRRTDGARWLLKMHGCVNTPEEIVLTRTDYLRYAEERGALMGIVQALLLTRHMLFVGFSLDDPNFHRIADAVRRAVRSSEREGARFGTALSLGERSFVAELWSDDLAWVSFARSGEGESATAEAARRLDVFLDCLAAHAQRADHLFDPMFEELMQAGSDEAELARSVEALRAIAQRMRQKDASSPALPVVERMLLELGAIRRSSLQ